MLRSFKLAAFILKIPLGLCTRVFNNFTMKEQMNVMIDIQIRYHAACLNALSINWARKGEILLSTANLNFWNWYFSLTIKSWRLPGNSISDFVFESKLYIYFFVMLIWLSRRISIITSKLFALKKWRHSSVFFVVKLETITIKIYLRGNNESRRFKDV